jgi:hypothetical protein
VRGSFISLGIGHDWSLQVCMNHALTVRFEFPSFNRPGILMTNVFGLLLMPMSSSSFLL